MSWHSFLKDRVLHYFFKVVKCDKLSYQKVSKLSKRFIPLDFLLYKEKCEIKETHSISFKNIIINCCGMWRANVQFRLVHKKITFVNISSLDMLDKSYDNQSFFLLQKDIVHPKPFDFEISCRCQKSFAIWRFSAPGLQRAVTVGFQHFLLQNSGMSSAQQPEKP